MKTSDHHLRPCVSETNMASGHTRVIADVKMPESEVHFGAWAEDYLSRNAEAEIHVDFSGKTGYIDFLKPEDLQGYSLVKGTDPVGRRFYAFRVRIEDRVKGEKFFFPMYKQDEQVLVVQQRYTGDPTKGVWVAAGLGSNGLETGELGVHSVNLLTSLVMSGESCRWNNVGRVQYQLKLLY